MATGLAEELGILPSGTLLVYEVVEQEEFFYNKLFSQDMATKIMEHKELVEVIR